MKKEECSMANCSICGEKMGIFDRESCSDGFVCKDAGLCFPILEWITKLSLLIN